jgi:ABC-type antimicrobial peptide transport system permease subunit
LPLDGTPTQVEFDLHPEVGGGRVPFSAPLELIGVELRGTPMALPPGVGPGDLVGDQAPPTIEIGITDLEVDGSPIGIGRREWGHFDMGTSSTSIIPPDASAVSDEETLTVEFNAGVDFFANSRPAVISLATAPGLAEQPPPIPVMLTDSLAETLGLGPGDTTAMTLRGRLLDVEVADTVSAVPFAIDSEEAVLADWSTLNTRQFLALGALEIPTDWALGIEADAVTAARDTLVNDPFRSVAVSDRVGVSDDIGRDPTTVGLSGSMVLAFVAALTVAAVGMVLTAVMGARHRRGGVAILRALGIHRGELRRLLVLETLPLVAVSAVAGILTGIGLARLSLRSVAVSPDGTPAIPEPLLVVPWPAIAVVAGLVVVIGAVLPLLTARLLGRQRPADEIRFGEAR